MNLLSAGEEIAGYRIESMLGRGGMAVVYRAEDTRLGRRVALKLLSPELMESEQFRLRFIRESRLASSLDHPNIIPIYEAGDAEGMLFIVMRLVVGSDLKAAIGGQPMDPARVLHLAAQTCNALDAAHAQGLVHRDVKPGNILVAPGPDDAEHVYLTDFGLTKRTSSLSGALTRTGSFLGTIDYVAPEQIAAKPVDPRTDIYALGCVLYECFTGQLPFHRDDDAALMWAHLVEAPPPVTAIRPDAGRAVDAVIARAMAKAPDDRYPSCHDLLTDLRAAILTRSAVPGARAGGAPASPAGAPPAPVPPLPVGFPPGPAAAEPVSSGTQHPSFPPGAFDPISGRADVPDLSPEMLPWRDDAPARDSAGAEAPDAAADEYAEEAYPDGTYPEEYASDEDYPEDEYPAEPAPDDEAAPPGRRPRWLVPTLAAALVLVVGGSLAFFFLRPGVELSRLQQRSQLVPFSFRYPDAWTADTDNIHLLVSASPDALRPLFLSGAGSADWSRIRDVMGSRPKDAVGMFTSFSSSGGPTGDQLKAALVALLPRSASFSGSWQDVVVGGLPGKRLAGSITDPVSGSQLKIVTYVVDVRSQLVQLTFFAAPSAFADSSATFTKMLGTVDFS